MLWLVLITLTCVYIYLKVIKPLSYWKDRGIPYLKPWPIIGNMGPTMAKRKPFIEQIQDFYNAFPNDRYFGTHQFTTPALMIRDVELIKKIGIKDFDHFTDHMPLVPDGLDPLLASNLFALKGQKWREMRATLSPAFTSSKMRAMFTLMSECSEKFIKYFEKQDSEVIILEMRDTFSRFTNDVIASIAAGLEVDSLEDRDNEFFLMGRKTFDFTGLINGLRFFLMNITPAIAKVLGVQFFTPDVSRFFRRIVSETIQHREREGLVRPDMIHLLMETRKGRLINEHDNKVIDSGFAVVEESIGKIEKHQKIELSNDDITAQALIFFIAGFETVSTLMSFAAYELAVNQDVQEKLHREIDETLEKCKGKITYETVLGMKYLDAVVSETLRKWPPGFRIDRMCVKDYTIPPVNPTEKPVTLEKGLPIFIPVYGIHRDPKFFPNPDKFDPERFSDDNKHKIEAGSYMPFGVGPRNCIASRFALLENKNMFFHLLSKFDIVVVDQTVIPIRCGTNILQIMPNEGVWLGFQKTKKK